MWIDQIPHCALTVHPTTMEQVVRVESAGNPLTVQVNGLAADRQPKPQTTAEAVAEAHHWVDLGYSVDLGLTEINSRNLAALHTTIEQILGTSAAAECANLAGGAEILTADYGAAVARFGPGQSALLAALSAYNTGTFDAGFRNGYVARYVTVPSIGASQTPKISAVTVKRHASDTEVW
ncbi:MAG: lytic transglycosylase domain-containing protein [Rhodopila sp.]|jgi:type IV secretion system protein VirB1